MKCPFVIKHCKKCDRLLVANTMNFYKQKDKKYGVACICKQCRGYQGENKKRKNKLTEEQKKQNKKLYDAKRYQNNKEKIKEYSKQYKIENKEKISQTNKLYREKHKEEIKEWHKKDYEDNPEKYFNNRQKRRQQEELQGDGINKEQWLEMMNFFDWKCAYSDIVLNDIYRSIDHIVPINKNGAHEVWNCVPMYLNYNLSKRASNPLEWYKKQDFYSEDRLNKIIKWQKYAYNKWNTKQLPLILITEGSDVI